MVSANKTTENYLREKRGKDFEAVGLWFSTKEQLYFFELREFVSRFSAQEKVSIS